eukprot:TRINITY_DN1114_c0_g1_i3.p1 TRINITY_DN1114_c0_g1~~TRINITY_DN1114_c0_g1_i3.p1  ORF type:complete len:131 (-),score=37.82 TRINITY_DN1114_c0_g1_i3:426-818(-)
MSDSIDQRNTGIRAFLDSLYVSSQRGNERGLNGQDIGEWLFDHSIHQTDIPKKFREKKIETIDDLAEVEDLPKLLSELKLNGFRKSKIQFAVEAFKNGGSDDHKMYAGDDGLITLQSGLEQAGKLKFLVV